MCDCAHCSCDNRVIAADMKLNRSRITVQALCRRKISGGHREENVIGTCYGWQGKMTFLDFEA